MPCHWSKTSCLMSLLPPVTRSVPAHWYQQHYDLLRHATEFFQCFPPPPLSSLMRFWLWELSGCWQLELASCGQQTFAISSWIPTITCLHGQLMKCLLLCPAPHFEGKRRSLRLWDLLSLHIAYSSWICLVLKWKKPNSVWLKNREMSWLSYALMILVMKFYSLNVLNSCFPFSSNLFHLCEMGDISPAETVLKTLLSFVTSTSASDFKV